MSSFLETVFKKAGQLSLKQLILVCVAVIILITIIARLQSNEEIPTSATDPILPQVTLTSLAETSAVSSVTLIGTVRAAAEASITAEVSGQVITAPVTLGARVQAGQIIATLENRSERAAVTQAEGVYDAAVAGASQNDLSLETAEQAFTNSQQDAVNTVRSAYNTVNDAFRNQIDTFYRQPNGISLPGIRISGEADFFNDSRIEFRDILENWQTTSTNLTINDDLPAALAESRLYTEKTITIVDEFLRVLDLRDNRDSTQFDVEQEKVAFAALRTRLLTLLSSIEQAESDLASSRIAVQQAAQTTSGGQNSSADAQIKQALGSLQAAQANLAKTILRSPIAGTVTALDVRAGDFVTTGNTVAIVSNTNALEIVTFAGSSERDRFAVGDTVILDSDATGRVAAISPSINEATGKTEIRIFSDSTELTNGDTVSVRTESTDTDVHSTSTFIPITAVKFTAEAGAVLRVDENNIVREQPVELGAVRAGQVEIVSGLSPTELFISDARGLTAGAEVTITN